jgi:YHS domain-containing protein
LPLAPALPAPAATQHNNFTNPPSSADANSVVANPHFGGQPASTGDRSQVPGQLISSGNSVTRPSITQFTPGVLPSDPQSISSKPALATASVPALSGYCPVALCSPESQWIKGSEKFAIRHRGRIYFLSDEAAAQKFLAAPDNYTPVLAGHDPLIYLREGRLVEGSIYDGVLKDKDYLLLFSSEENKRSFYDNYDRYISELEAVVRQHVR